MFFVYDFVEPPSRIRWDYDRFFWRRWCRESHQALLAHPERTEDPEQADFFVVSTTLACVSFVALPYHDLLAELPYRDGGRPHVVFDLTDRPMPIFEGEDLVICKSAWHEELYDPSRSVAIPQFPRYRFGRPFQPASKRPYLAGFKGHLRADFNDLRTRLTALDDGHRIVIRGGVFQPEHLRITASGEAHEVPREGERSYTEILFDSCFALLPRGNGYALSYRMIESMDAGCVPVILSDGHVLPFSEVLDYTSFALRIDEAEIDRLGAILEAQLPRADAMQAAARPIFQTFFASTGAMIDHTLAIVARLPMVG